MKHIALVSVTLNAVNPMTDYFREKEPEIKIDNYLDSHLLEKVRDEGGINDAAMKRMFHMLSTACEDGAEGVLLTCTVFSPYADYFSRLLSRPIICPDRAMLEAVAQRAGRAAIICTFPGTVDTTRAMYIGCCKRAGTDETVDMIILEDAYLAAGKGDFAVHDKIIQEKAKQLDGQYDHIVFAQISMARAAKGLKLQHAQVYTSPDSAYRALEEAVAHS